MFSFHERSLQLRKRVYSDSHPSTNYNYSYEKEMETINQEKGGNTCGSNPARGRTTRNIITNEHLQSDPKIGINPRCHDGQQKGDA
jgi:hypothetical protein